MSLRTRLREEEELETVVVEDDVEADVEELVEVEQQLEEMKTPGSAGPAGRPDTFRQSVLTMNQQERITRRR